MQAIFKEDFVNSRSIHRYSSPSNSCPLTYIENNIHPMCTRGTSLDSTATRRGGAGLAVPSLLPRVSSKLLISSATLTLSHVMRLCELAHASLKRYLFCDHSPARFRSCIPASFLVALIRMRAAIDNWFNFLRRLISAQV